MLNKFEFKYLVELEKTLAVIEEDILKEDFTRNDEMALVRGSEHIRKAIQEIALNARVRTEKERMMDRRKK